ncbi:MAG: encapsulin-associated ferritin-like protein [Polyangiaceae bacterium]
MGSENLHEAPELLSEATKNMHRAIVSLMEELEAVDWYSQRSEACSDKDLAAILQHNKREEMEHAMMVLEWIRRQSSELDGHMKTYLNTSGPITGVEEEIKQGGGDDPKADAITHDGSLGVGGLKGA